MEQILDATELSTFRSGSPEERVKFLSSLSEEKFADVIEAMPPQMRQRLMFTGTPELRRRAGPLLPPRLRRKTQSEVLGNSCTCYGTPHAPKGLPSQVDHVRSLST